MDILTLVKKLNEYNVDIDKILRAYNLANELHNGQFRQSGEPYISHPLNVAYILAEMRADTDTICAGLLHDTLEDTDIAKEEISEQFGEVVANLVDGVTKMRKFDFSSKEERNMANTRKIITGISDDVRIIIIKLADRLHNMRTLEYKSEYKQKEIAIETLEIFTPLAFYIGAYDIKTELEDISLMYSKPDEYKRIKEIRDNFGDDCSRCLIDMYEVIDATLKKRNIPNELKIKIKNIYGIYRQFCYGHKISEIHDLLSFIVIVDTIENCYLSLMEIHANFPPLNDKFRDYICNPKANMYRSLHTTVFGPYDKLVQTQIRTFEMEKSASYGLISYWNNNNQNNMQNDLSKKYQFLSSLSEIDNMFDDNKDFVNQVKNELFADKVNVYTPKGDMIELPQGATVIDFAYKIHSNLGNTMTGAIVNDEAVPIDYVLKNDDRVKVITNNSSLGPDESWLDKVTTTKAKRKIKEYRK